MNQIYHDLKEETKKNKLFIPVILILLTIPLKYAFNSISIGLLLVVTLVTYNKKEIISQKKLWPLIFCYSLMAISILWSIDVPKTLSALPKEMPLLIIPLCFLIFKPFTNEQISKILKYYSNGMVAFAIYYLIRATIRFSISNDYSVFLYHELVTKDVNAIYVSIFMALASFYFLSQMNKTKIDIASFALLTFIIFLLSSKNVIVVFVALVFLYFFGYAKISNKIKYFSILSISLLLVSLLFVKQIRDRFLVEIKTNVTENTIAEGAGAVVNVSVRQAWTSDSFTPNNFFPGTAFRVYQTRIFLEMMQEDPVFFTGFGLNASNIKIKEKADKYNIHPGYAKYNFHSQYVQIFAELGVVGFISLIIILYINTRKAFVTKNFVHIAFAILMIMLFVTESFLWRQRGVVYFTVLYCVFNSQSQKQTIKNFK